MKFGTHYEYNSIQLCAKFERDIIILNVWSAALTLTRNLANEEIRFSNAGPDSHILRHYRSGPVLIRLPRVTACV